MSNITITPKAAQHGEDCETCENKNTYGVIYTTVFTDFTNHITLKIILCEQCLITFGRCSREARQRANYIKYRIKQKRISKEKSKCQK